ncbi:zinc finger HIT domain-containing protein 2 [Sceloporus undulatus]|uniref:zinc finger HIT domain-containing protein 2 n=1 Tax=Sceloporus undulatus TaxID=8520 RepID=UPI001C4C9462|nr:zinc finger HIT domain-containing protein 2 [Sceloporus undulatus]
MPRFTRMELQCFKVVSSCVSSTMQMLPYAGTLSSEWRHEWRRKCPKLTSSRRKLPIGRRVRRRKLPIGNRRWAGLPEGSSEALLEIMEFPSSIPGSGHCCGLCQAPAAPYTCPRCHLRLCSVPCYRGHGSCAQDFQSRELQLRFQGLRGDEASRRRLREALLRLRELREPGDAEAQLGLDPNFDLEEEAEEKELWEQLNPEQRKAFQALLSSGEISSLLPPWKPWWDQTGAALIEELGSSNGQAPLIPSQGGEASSKSPEKQTSSDISHLAQAARLLNSVPDLIPPLASLTANPVSPLVRFQLPNALYAYAYSLSLYNGDVDDDGQLLPEFCETVLDVSGSLGARRVYQSVAEALQDALRSLADGEYPECPLGNARVMLAVGRILMGQCQAKQKGFALAALSHLSRLLRKGKKRVPAQDRGRLFGAQKKCDFLLSWVNDNQAELTLLALEVQREYKSHADAVQALGAVTQELEKMWGGKVPPAKKPLIEELD